MPAQAQTDAQEEPSETTLSESAAEEIIVTGIRGALESAKQIKRNADTFVDSITASDIATLPDLSVAEAIGRIPGVTISRFPTGGASPDFPSPEGRGNLVRGLGFVRSEFNGRDAFSANGGRALDFSSIPPELVGGVDVYKNQSADLIEGGIGGTINLKTLEPFDRADDIFAMSLEGTYSDLRKKWSPSGSVTAGKRWDTEAGEFGILGSLSRSVLKSRIHGWQQSQPIPRVLGPGGVVPQITNLNDDPRLDEFDNYDPANVVGITPGFQLRTNDVDRDRQSYYLAGQWRRDGLQITGKYIRVDTDIESTERTWEWFPDQNLGVNAGVRDLTLDNSWGSRGLPVCSGPGGRPVAPGSCETLIDTQGGLMQSGYVTSSIDGWFGAQGNPVTSLGIGVLEETKTEDFSLNLKWNANDRLFITVDGQYTKADARRRQIWGGVNTYLEWSVDHDLDHPRLEFFVNPTHQFGANQTRFTGDGDDPNTSVVENNPLIARPTSAADFNGANFQFVADQFQVGEGDLYALRSDVDYDISGNDGLLGWFDSIKFGARYSERRQVNSEMGLNWGAMAPAWSGQGGAGIVGTFQDPNSGFEAVDFRNFFRGDGVVQGPNNQFVFMRGNLLNNYSTFRKYILSEPQLGTRHDWNPRGTDDGTAFGAPNFRPEDISDITERTKNAYVRLDFKQDFSNGMSIDGNFGVRYVRTDLNSSGFLAFRAFDAQDIPECPPDEAAGSDECQYRFNPSTGERLRTDDAESRDDIRDFAPEAVAYAGQAAIPINSKITDEHWLPSFNVKLNLNPEMLVRFGYSKGLSRPNVQDLRASREYVVATQRTSFPQILDPADPLYQVDRGVQDIAVSEIRVSRGNPTLRPTTADNFDLSYEYYFRGGYLSVAGFYKNLSNIITNGDLTLGSVTLDGQEVNIIYNGPVNQAKAKIKGIELAYQQFFDFLPGPLKHFGFQGNYTYIDASTTPPGNGTDADGDGLPDDLTQVFRWGVDDLLGQSKHIANAVAIYQDSQLELRLAYNWRSRYLTSYRDYVTGNPVFNSAAGFLDASVRYSIGNATLRASIANILDTKSKSQVQIDESGQMYDRFSFLNDRRIVVGVLFSL